MRVKNETRLLIIKWFITTKNAIEVRPYELTNELTKMFGYKFDASNVRKACVRLCDLDILVRNGKYYKLKLD